MKVLIIGGVAGGATTATRLRRLVENAEIVIFERGEYISFANCGLPYYIGNKIEKKSDLILQTPSSFKKRFNIDVRILNEVLSIDRENKEVTVRNIKEDVTYVEKYDKLVLSPGAEPIKPNIEGINSEKIFSIRNIPDTYRVKEYIEKNSSRKAIVVGGGYIGIEMVENLHNLGIEVTVVEMSNHLIGPLDTDMASFVHNYLNEKGINIILSNGVTKFEDKTNNIEVQLQDKILSADMVILSIGVRPESKLAVEAGLEVNSRGSIVVNEKMETSDKDIYALGDAAEITNYITNQKGFIPLAGPANKQARVVANNICNVESVYKGTQGSSILKVFDMTVAMTGINETTAKSLDLECDKIYITPYSHATYYPGAKPMMMKIIYEKKTGRILGAQIVGYDMVDKRCDVLAVAIRAGMTAYDLTELELCYAPQFSSAKDPVNIAGYTIENVLQGKVKNVYLEDFEQYISDENTAILDVRTKGEYIRGYIGNAINIPLDNLRDNIDKLNKNKKIIIYCQSGLRSYIACSILGSSGFDIYNVTGGYGLYISIKESNDKFGKKID